MGTRLEITIQYTMLALCAVSPLIWLRKQPIKDWLIIYFLKGYISGFIDSFLVSYHILSYPVRLFPEVFKISILFDMFVFPILCVFYNQTSYRSKLPGIIGQALLYSLPVALFEYWAEEQTNLIEYFRWWTIYHSYFYLTLTFVFVRAFIAIIRRFSKS